MFWHAAREGLVDPACSVQVGIRTDNPDRIGFQWLEADWIHGNGPDATAAAITARVGDRPAYLTFDIDCLDPAFAPGTGTPVCGGLSSYQALAVLRQLGSLKLVGMDLTEVSPPYDHAQITALAGATIVLEYLCLRAAAA
jgi:agmatinase